ncbi:hypothetical protein [uncultured Muriicola sp.]|uniref:hypothetical protein n=1 Tax=uncultured Muriicola sp. TaxID=1583102 RepID=UPI0026293E59|nr:hypothetical protein [uncultured Muriicola sp.]
MMDELELLKKDWKSKESEHPKLSYDELYGMIWKRSSSIVKWIFIISIIEFVLPHLVYLLPSAREGMQFYEDLGLKNLMWGITIVQYLVVFYFIYQFYQRYREISALDNAKELMHKIIRTRKTVKNYIIFALSMFLITFLLIAIGIALSEGDTFIHALNLEEKAMEDSIDNIKFVVVGVLIAMGILCTAFLGLIYFLIYGLLLRKLGKNYRELKRLEI